MMEYICKQVNLTCCTLLFDEPPQYLARKESIGPLHIHNPATSILLAFVLFAVLKMVKSVKYSYTSIGRKEMNLFLHIYFVAMLLEAVNITGVVKVFGKSFNTILTAIQMAFAAATIFSLVVGAITSHHTSFYHILPGQRIAKILSFISFAAYSVLLVIGLIQKNQWIVFSVFICSNGFLLFLYAFIQFKRLYREKRDFWAWSTFFLAIFFFILGCIPMVVGSSIIALLTERYLDSLFFFHLFLFSSIVMLHKFWLSVTEDEQECVLLKYGAKGRVK